MNNVWRSDFKGILICLNPLFCKCMFFKERIKKWSWLEKKMRVSRFFAIVSQFLSVVVSRKANMRSVTKRRTAEFQAGSRWKENKLDKNSSHDHEQKQMQTIDLITLIVIISGEKSTRHLRLLFCTEKDAFRKAIYPRAPEDKTKIQVEY